MWTDETELFHAFEFEKATEIITHFQFILNPIE